MKLSVRYGFYIQSWAVAAAMLLLLAPAAGAQVDSLAAYWDFSETSGTTLGDGSGNGLDLGLTGGVTLGGPGAFSSTGTAAEFDAGGLGLGSVPDQAPLTGLRDNFSLAAWVRVEPGGPWAIRRIFGAGGAGWSCGVTASGFRFTTKGIQDFDLGLSYPVSTWFHYAVVFDTAHDVTFYLDGVAVGTVNGSSPANPPNSDWLLGSWDGIVEYWHGGMDDVQVYDGTLTAADVAFLFQNPGATVAPAGGSSFCFGDGTAAVCPCGNFGAFGEGCRNSVGTGAELSALGTTSLLAADLQLHGDRLVPGRMAILFGGQNLLNGASGVLFGDGLRCAGDPVQRLGIRTADSTGHALWLGAGVAAQGGWAPGETHRVQVWYEDPLGSMCGFGFNTSQALELTISP
jgi:hypothetical protein